METIQCLKRNKTSLKTISHSAIYILHLLQFNESLVSLDNFLRHDNNVVFSYKQNNRVSQYL